MLPFYDRWLMSSNNVNIWQILRIQGARGWISGLCISLDPTVIDLVSDVMIV